MNHPVFKKSFYLSLYLTHRVWILTVIQEALQPLGSLESDLVFTLWPQTMALALSIGIKLAPVTEEIESKIKACVMITNNDLLMLES